MTTTPDPRPLFTQTLDQCGRLVDAVTPDDLDHPTPCADFDVRTLLGHLIAVEWRVVHIAQGGHPFEVPSLATHIPQDGWATAWKAARVDLDAAMADDDVLVRPLHHPAGDFPGFQAVFAYVSEVAVHGWDLAMATGHRDDVDDVLAAACLETVRRFLPAEPRGEGVPFGSVVDVPADAPAYDRLVGWMGRDPHWAA